MIQVLSLDDNPSLLEAMSQVLRSAGYESLTTTDSNEAWTLLKTVSIDLFTQDLFRPGIGGLEFYRRMRSDKALRDIPVILITASRLEPDFVESLGVDGYVTKPFDPQELLTVIASVLTK